jgi:hypothetical protein
VWLFARAVQESAGADTARAALMREVAARLAPD